MGAVRPIFHAMNTKRITYAGALAALYVVLTYAQNWIFPGSTSMAIQMRLSEALCVLAFFTPRRSLPPSSCGSCAVCASSGCPFRGC